MGFGNALAAGGLLCILSSAASADVHTFKTAGPWRAYGGLANDGRRVCGISAQGEGHWFGLKYFEGERAVTIQLGSKEWRIKNGQTQSVVMQIDNDSPWKAVGTGMHFSDGDAGLEFDIGRAQIDQFMNEFSNGNEMAIHFPNSPVVDWTANLDGSDEISAAFLQCLHVMRSVENED